MARASIILSSTVFACAREAVYEPRVHVPHKVTNSKVLIMGGTGRVGGSTAIALSKMSPDLQIIVGGRNRDKGAAMVAEIGDNSDFAEVDFNDLQHLERSLSGYYGPLSIIIKLGSPSADVDLVIHAAGPFQQAEKCTVLEAAIQTKTAYIDVCDDTSYALRAKSYHSKALAANVPAITTAGIYPGVSNVMAAEMAREARSKDDTEPNRLRFSYYTAGTGGAGPTILATSFLLLGEKATTFIRGEMVKHKSYSRMLSVDFGKGIGRRDVFLLNLPEVTSAHQVLKIPTVIARFGTSPFFWNWGMQIMANLLPEEYLKDRTKIWKLVQSFDPIVRAVDSIAGERVSMRVDLDCSNGRTKVGIFTHKKLSVSVGNATAAFALAVLEGSTQPGVWFPEEPQGIAVDAREVLLKRAAQGTINFVMNKSPWMVATNPKEIGLGIYV